MLASMIGEGEAVEKLLGKGASIDVEKKLVSTALMLAIEKGHGQVVMKLVMMMAAELLRKGEVEASKKGTGKKKEKGGAEEVPLLAK